MKKTLLILACASMAIPFSSCEKCATCTTTEDDPGALNETRTTEICGRGRDYDDQITIYERTNWECTEN